MFVSVGDAQYRVQFVYSARDLNESRALDVPGTLRQLVDNLALSLNRRVAFAEVALVEHIKDPYTLGDIASFVPIAQGVSVCHWKDNFAKKEGRGRSLYRALKNAGNALAPSTKDAIVSANGFGSYAQLREQVTAWNNPQDAKFVRAVVARSLSARGNRVERATFDVTDE